MQSKRLLVGPPNSDVNILTNIENSTDLARDTEISEIVILGDFNLNVDKPESYGKINNICENITYNR